jgi:hypothetical protein
MFHPRDICPAVNNPRSPVDTRLCLSAHLPLPELAESALSRSQAAIVAVKQGSEFIVTFPRASRGEPSERPLTHPRLCVRF